MFLQGPVDLAYFTEVDRNLIIALSKGHMDKYNLIIVLLKEYMDNGIFFVH